MKSAHHKRINAIWFHFCKVPRVVRFLDTERRMVSPQLGRGGNGMLLLNGLRVPVEEVGVLREWWWTLHSSVSASDATELEAQKLLKWQSNKSDCDFVCLRGKWADQPLLALRILCSLWRHLVTSPLIMLPDVWQVVLLCLLNGKTKHSSDYLYFFVLIVALKEENWDMWPLLLTQVMVSLMVNMYLAALFPITSDFTVALEWNFYLRVLGLKPELHKCSTSELHPQPGILFKRHLKLTVQI